MKLGSRAISLLIASIVLISIRVAGGLMIYSVFFSTSGTLTAKGELTVEAIDLVKDTDGNIVFTITIKNTGNKPISSCTVTICRERNKIKDIITALKSARSNSTESPSIFISRRSLILNPSVLL